MRHQAKFFIPFAAAVVMTGCGTSGSSIPAPSDYIAKPAVENERCYIQDYTKMERSGRALIESAPQFYFHPDCQYHTYQEPPAAIELPEPAGLVTDPAESDADSVVDANDGKNADTTEETMLDTGADSDDSASAGGVDTGASSENIDPDTGLPYCPDGAPEPQQVSKMPVCVYR